MLFNIGWSYDFREFIRRMFFGVVDFVYGKFLREVREGFLVLGMLVEMIFRFLYVWDLVFFRLCL